jgi:hypothetical protein
MNTIKCVAYAPEEEGVLEKKGAGSLNWNTSLGLAGVAGN